MDPLIWVMLIGGAAFLLFGTGTPIALVGPNGLQTGGPAADRVAQRTAAGQGNMTAQNIAAGTGNTAAQDLSALGGVLSGVGAIAKDWNLPGGGSAGGSARAPPVTGSTTGNDPTGGTQDGNNWDISGSSAELTPGTLTPIDSNWGTTGTGQNPSTAAYTNLSADMGTSDMG